MPPKKVKSALSGAMPFVELLLTWTAMTLSVPILTYGVASKTKAANPPPWSPSLLPLTVDDRNDVRSVEFQEQALSRFVGADCVVQAIPADAAVVIIASILSIEIVPRVR